MIISANSLYAAFACQFHQGCYFCYPPQRLFFHVSSNEHQMQWRLPRIPAALQCLLSIPEILKTRPERSLKRFSLRPCLSLFHFLFLNYSRWCKLRHNARRKSPTGSCERSMALMSIKRPTQAMQWSFSDSCSLPIKNCTRCIITCLCSGSRVARWPVFYC